MILKYLITNQVLVDFSKVFLLMKFKETYSKIKEGCLNWVNIFVIHNNIVILHNTKILINFYLFPAFLKRRFDSS